MLVLSELPGPRTKTFILHVARYAFWLVWLEFEGRVPGSRMAGTTEVKGEPLEQSLGLGPPSRLLWMNRSADFLSLPPFLSPSRMMRLTHITMAMLARLVRVRH